MTSKWINDSQAKIMHLKTEYSKDGNAMEYYVMDMPVFPRKSIFPLPIGLNEEQSPYQILSNLMEGMKKSFEAPKIRQSYSPFKTVLDDIVTLPQIKRAKSKCKKYKVELDEIIEFLHENKEELKIDSYFWSVTEDWVLSFLEKVSKSYALAPSSYADEARHRYKDLCAQLKY